MTHSISENKFGMESFKMILPSLPLQKWVHYFWYSKEPGAFTSTQYMVVADGSSGLIFQIGARSIFKNDGNAMPLGFVYGQATESCLNAVKKQLMVLGIRFKQGALQALSKENASSLTNTVMSLECVFTSSELDRLVNQPTLKALIASFELLLLQKFKQQRHSDTLITFSTQMIEDRIYNIAAPQLYKEFNLSERQFQRRFKQQVGVSAETYIRIIKIQKAMQLLKRGSYQKRSDVAYTLNYADQSHFIREFKQFSGFTPTSYEKKAKELQFSKGNLPFPCRRIIPY